jgi:hypothetical protein
MRERCRAAFGAERTAPVEAHNLSEARLLPDADLIGTEINRHGIDREAVPPGPFVAVPVKFAVMKTANRNRELIADLASLGSSPQRGTLAWTRI